MNLKALRAAALKAAQDIIAAASGRDLTADEVKSLREKRDEISDLDSRIKAQEDGDELIKSLGGLAPSEESPSSRSKREAKSKSLGRHFIQEAGERLKQVRGISGASVSSSEFKAPTDTIVTGGPGDDETGILLTQVDRTIVQGFRRPLITDLFGSGTISGQAITYFVEGALEGDFATVAEAGEKPQLSATRPTQMTDALSKIAGFIKLSDEMIEDFDFLVSEIDSRLMYQLALMEEVQVVRGDGVGTNLLGVLNRSGIQTEVAASASDNVDALYRAITKVQTVTGMVADGLVIHPTDYQAIRLTKDANSQYLAGGPFQGQYGNGGIDWQPSIWGLRTVVSTAAVAGSPFLGAFEQATTLYRKGGVRVESTNSHAEDFTSNLVTVRAEERIALAVRKPSAIVQVTLA